MRRQMVASIAVDITPLIDCVFLLIVFFVISGTFRGEERSILIPMDLSYTPGDSKYTREFVGIRCVRCKVDNGAEWRVNETVAKSKMQVLELLRKHINQLQPDQMLSIWVDVDSELPLYWAVASMDVCYMAGQKNFIMLPPRIGRLDEWPRPLPRLLAPRTRRKK